MRCFSVASAAHGWRRGAAGGSSKLQQHGKQAAAEGDCRGGHPGLAALAGGRARRSGAGRPGRAAAHRQGHAGARPGGGGGHPFQACGVRSSGSDGAAVARCAAAPGGDTLRHAEQARGGATAREGSAQGAGRGRRQVFAPPPLLRGDCWALALAVIRTPLPLPQPPWPRRTPDAARPCSRRHRRSPSSAPSPSLVAPHRLSLRMSPAPAPPQPLPELPRCGGLPNVLVVGAGGVGKSTLIGWLNARAAESRLELAAAEGMPSGRALEAYAKVDAASA